jgi:hypothetical protein
MSSERPPGNGKGRRPRASTDTRTNSSPNRAKKQDEHPSPSLAQKLNQLLADACDVTYALGTAAHGYECGRCAGTSTHLLDAIDALYSAYRAYTGKQEVSL